MHYFLVAMVLIKAPVEIELALHKASATTGIPIEILRAVAWEESQYNPKVTSNKGAMGLMQIMPVVAENFKVEDPYNPLENALAGAKLLKSYYKQNHRNWPKTFASYNWGLRNVRENNTWPVTTMNYVTRIIKNLKPFLGAFY